MIRNQINILIENKNIYKLFIYNRNKPSIVVSGNGNENMSKRTAALSLIGFLRNPVFPFINHFLLNRGFLLYSRYYWFLNESWFFFVYQNDTGFVAFETSILFVPSKIEPQTSSVVFFEHIKWPFFNLYERRKNNRTDRSRSTSFW